MGFDGDTIISAVCPAGLCCQLADGCDYIENEGDLCAKYRDFESELCSECIEGYSESINSEQCTECDGDHWEYLLLPFGMAIFTTGILLFTNREKKDSALKRSPGKMKSILKTGNIAKWFKRLKSGENKIVIMSITKIAVYYYQVMYLSTLP